MPEQQPPSDGPRFSLRMMFSLVFLLGVASWFLSQVHRAREDARQSSCVGHRAQIYHALLEYHDINGHLPPAYVLGPDGKRWHSWRALILPYLDEDLAQKYRFDEPWNGPNNSQLANSTCARSFQCQSGPDIERTAMTNFAVIVGDDTLFPGAKSATIPNMIDYLDPTILFVEIADSDIPWLEPRDLSIDQLTRTPGKPHFGSHHPSGVGITRANRSFEHLPRSLSKEELIRQCTRLVAR